MEAATRALPLCCAGEPARLESSNSNKVLHRKPLSLPGRRRVAGSLGCAALLLVRLVHAAPGLPLGLACTRERGGEASAA